MHGVVTKIEAVGRRIEAHDVGIRRCHHKHLPLPITRLRSRIGGRVGRIERSRIWCWVARLRSVVDPRHHHVLKHRCRPAGCGRETKTHGPRCGQGAVPTRTPHGVGRATTAHDFSIPHRTDLACEIKPHRPPFNRLITCIGDGHLTGKARPPVTDHVQGRSQLLHGLGWFINRLICRRCGGIAAL